MFKTNHSNFRFTGQPIFPGQTHGRIDKDPSQSHVQRRLEAAAPNHQPKGGDRQDVSKLFRHSYLEDKRLCRENGRGQIQGGRRARQSSILH